MSDAESEVKSERKSRYRLPISGVREFLATNEHVQEVRSHFKNSVIESLKAFQSLIDVEIDLVKRCAERKEGFTKIKVEEG